MRPCILLSYAHPDDESFLTGGTIAKYSGQGVQIVLFCATRGDAGKAGQPPVCTREELPAVRESELRTAAKILGIGPLHMSHYPDRGLSQATPEAIRKDLVLLLRRYRPQLVISFDPNGSNQHSDHIAISRFTSDAVSAAADDRWFAEAGPAHQVQRLLWTGPVRPWEAARDDALESRPGVDFILDTHPWWRRKADALRAHRSQHLATERIFFNQPDVERLMSLEVFRHGWGPVLPRRPLEDLFTGVDAGTSGDEPQGRPGSPQASP